MKNKKGGKAQKFMQTVQKQSVSSGKNKEEVSLISPLVYHYTRTEKDHELEIKLA
jgi:hypothetical protein